MKICNSPQPFNLYQTSLNCMSEWSKVKEKYTNLALARLKEVADEYEDFEPSHIARKIAREAYQGFETELKQKFPDPNYSGFLESSIRGEYPYFTHDLVNRIRQIMAEKAAAQ